jgi:hypothetical protein
MHLLTNQLRFTKAYYAARCNDLETQHDRTRILPR